MGTRGRVVGVSKVLQLYNGQPGWPSERASNVNELQVSMPLGLSDVCCPREGQKTVKRAADECCRGLDRQGAVESAPPVALPCSRDICILHFH